MLFHTGIPTRVSWKAGVFRLPFSSSPLCSSSLVCLLFPIRKLSSRPSLRQAMQLTISLAPGGCSKRIAQKKPTKPSSIFEALKTARRPLSPSSRKSRQTSNSTIPLLKHHGTLYLPIVTCVLDFGEAPSCNLWRRCAVRQRSSTTFQPSSLPWVCQRI